MIKAGKNILGVPPNTSNDCVRAELGWATMEERAEVAKMKFLHRLRTLPNNRLVKKLFIIRMRQAKEQVRKKREVKSWCHELRRIMNKYAIGEEWTEIVDESRNVAEWKWWKNSSNGISIKEKVEEKQRENMRRSIEEKKKGEYYMKCKKRWEEEEYLNENGSKEGRIWKTKMRMSAAPLKAIKVMEHQAVSDMCMLCEDGAVEDQQHFMLYCGAYEEEREAMYQEIMERIGEEEWYEMRWGNANQGLDTVLLSEPRIDSCVRNYLDSAWRIRKLRFGV